MMGNYLKENNVKVKDETDVNSIMRDMMSIILEGALDQEMDEELGYSKYHETLIVILVFPLAAGSICTRCQMPFSSKA